MLSISKLQIEIDDVSCGSVEVTLTILKVTTSTFQTLEKAVKDGKVKVEVDGESYVAKQVTRPASPTSGSSSSSDRNLAFWLYVSFGAAMGLLFVVGLAILLVRCRRDRVTKSFTVNSDAELELKRYRGIPRASYYRVEMYGDAVEIDAAHTGIDEEYDGDVVPYVQGGATFSPDEQDSGHANNNPGKQSEFGMGNLPEWNVPKLKSSDVVVHSNTGSSGYTEVHDDALNAYDNPVMTFGGSTDDINDDND